MKYSDDEMKTTLGAMGVSKPVASSPKRNASVEGGASDDGLPVPTTTITTKESLPVKKKKKKSYIRVRDRLTRKKPIGMPSRPLNAYNFFFSEQRLRIKKEREKRAIVHQDQKVSGVELFSAMGKEVADRWRQLSPDERTKYEAQATADKKRYNDEMEDYNRKVLARMHPTTGHDAVGMAGPGDATANTREAYSTVTTGIVDPPCQTQTLAPSASPRPLSEHSEVAGVGGAVASMGLVAERITADDEIRNATFPPAGASFGSDAHNRLQSNVPHHTIMSGGSVRAQRGSAFRYQLSGSHNDVTAGVRGARQLPRHTLATMMNGALAQERRRQVANQLLRSGQLGNSLFFPSLNQQNQTASFPQRMVPVPVADPSLPLQLLRWNPRNEQQQQQQAPAPVATTLDVQQQAHGMFPVAQLIQTREGIGLLLGGGGRQQQGNNNNNNLAPLLTFLELQNPQQLSQHAPQQNQTDLEAPVPDVQQS